VRRLADWNGVIRVGVLRIWFRGLSLDTQFVYANSGFIITKAV